MVLFFLQATFDERVGNTFLIKLLMWNNVLDSHL